MNTLHKMTHNIMQMIQIQIKNDTWKYMTQINVHVTKYWNWHAPFAWNSRCLGCNWRWCWSLLSRPCWRSGLSSTTWRSWLALWCVQVIIFIIALVIVIIVFHSYSLASFSMTLHSLFHAVTHSSERENSKNLCISMKCISLTACNNFLSKMYQILLK